MTATIAEDTLSLAQLHGSLTDPALASMTFLNEIANRFPQAISFAAGRPFEGFFDTELVHRYLRRYERYLRDERGMSQEQVRRTVLQYGRTKGIIHELVARNLAVDEGIEVDPEAIVVTVGFQEAVVLALRALRADHRDVVLAVQPGYVGLTGAARLLDMPVLGVASDEHGIDLADLRRVIDTARADGLRPRACYLVPDFANPSGVTMDLPTRRALLDLARAEDLLVLEDNPYGVFSADGTRLPTLKALDEHHTVVYLGSFAKTGLPGARVGFVVADQPIAEGGLLADQLAKIKSMVTVNTSPIAQAVIAGKLLEHDFSLVAANTRETALYRRNRDLVLAALARHFPDPAGPVRCNAPGGGFFLVVDVPFAADDEMVEISARDHGVLWTPMRHFHDAPAAARRIRLSYSQLTPDQIEDGITRLARFLTTHSTPEKGSQS
jgi:(S)-3,5-dihydroxyphenylglycine transaminase